MKDEMNKTIKFTDLMEFEKKVSALNKKGKYLAFQPSFYEAMKKLTKTEIVYQYAVNISVAIGLGLPKKEVCDLCDELIEILNNECKEHS